MRSAALPAFVASLLALGSCRGPRFPDYVVLAQPDPAAVEIAPWSGVAAELQARAVLSGAGTEIDFTLLARLQPPAELVAVAVTDLGGTVFHVEVDADGARVESGAGALSEGELEDVGRDLALAFLGPDLSRAVAVRTSSARSAWLVPARAGDAREVLLELDASGSPRRAERGRRGRLEATIELADWTAATPGAPRHPGRIDVRSTDGRRLTLQVLRCTSPSTSPGTNREVPR